MSPTSNSGSTFVDPHYPREPVDDFGLNPNPPPFESHLLSPFNPAKNLSGSTSPAYLVTHTPGGESISEYSNYQSSELSELEDPFFGVDFDAGVQRFDSIPLALPKHVEPQPTNISLSSDTRRDSSASKVSGEAHTTSAYPLSPILSSIPNTPSPRPPANGLKYQPKIPQPELASKSLSSQYYHSHNPLTPANPITKQLTPDHSGSSHTSAEGVRPSTMNRPEQSPHIAISEWGSVQPPSLPNAFNQPDEYQASVSNGNHFSSQFHSQVAESGVQSSVVRDEEGSWRPSEMTGQAGLDPETRHEISHVEIPNLKQQEERRRIESKNFEVQEWRSQTGSDDDDETTEHSYFTLNHQIWQDSASNQQGSHHDDDSEIAPVDDAASIRENRLVEGQTYYNFKNAKPTQIDYMLMGQSRHWSDGPTFPQMTATSNQPLSSNEAMKKWNTNADNFSLASRAATWGTRRRSEPNLADIAAVDDGSFLKRLSLSKSKEGGRARQNSIFDRGLQSLGEIVRKKSDSKLKRARSSHNIPEEAHIPQTRTNSQDTLAPPQTSNYGPNPTPTINTIFAAISPLAATGHPQIRSVRSGSVGGTATSPKSPLHLPGFAKNAKNVITRVRSKSELNPHDKAAQPGLANLWRGHGGPPVPAMSSTQVEPEVKQFDAQDQDDDDDEDDDVADEGDLKMDPESEVDLIVPNYEGFKAHVRHLNPGMNPKHSWLVSRIAHQQETRYKNLLDLRVKHSQAVNTRSCSAGRHCISLGGSATLIDGKGHPREPESNSPGLQLVTDFSDDSNPGEGALTDESFPPGVPKPATRNLPAEFECQLCFRAKKFQKPSDWTKHVHEDVQPFTCTYDKCKESKSFKRKADWVRHENERHRHLEWWVCQVDDCKHSCYRKDNFLQHLVREHKLPEPKEKTKAAVKKARTTEVAWVLLERCHHETPNRPQDEPCKFCGKQFTTWKKLTVHLAKHMEHISLPILRLVETKNVDANTIISPVEQIITPITPVGRQKIEPTSPFDMSSIASHGSLVPNFSSTNIHQPQYFQPPTSNSAYGSIHSSIPQAGTYIQNPSIYPTAYGISYAMNQSHGFGPLHPTDMNHMERTQDFNSMNPGNIDRVKMEQAQDFGLMGHDFSHETPDSYDSHQNTAYPLPHDFSEAPSVSSYPQSTNVLGISETGYDFDPMSVTASPNITYGNSPDQNAHSTFYTHQ